MKKKQKNKQLVESSKEYNTFFTDILFNSGLFILLFIVINVLLTSTMFIFHVSISQCYLWISLFLTIIIMMYFLIKKNNLNFKYIIGSFILPLVIIFLSIFGSGKFFDFTWDGNSYHKSTIGFLIDGWNPLYETMKEFDDSSKVPININESSYIWGEHYAQFSHFFAANIGIVTKNIESGKALNIMSMYVLFAFVLCLLFKKYPKNYLFNILFSLSLITCTTIGTQFLTNYVDLLVYIYLFLLIIIFFYFEFDQDKKNESEQLLVYFSVLIALINIKFSSFGYAGIMCLGYYILYLFRYKKIKPFFIKFTIVSVLAVLIGVFVVGLSVYPKNFKEHGHPFYAVFGEGKYDIMTANQPEYFQTKSPIEKFTIATFSKAANISLADKKTAEFKLPFTVYKSELEYLNSCDLRISGNGILFSGILLISLVVLLFGMRVIYKKNIKLFWLILIPCVITLVLIFTMSDVWWARYFPQLHLIVFFALIVLNELGNKYFKFLILIVLLINNIIPLIMTTKTAYNHTFNVNYQFVLFEQNTTVKDCNLIVDNHIFQGTYFDIKYKLPEYNIKFDSLNNNYGYYFDDGFAVGICEEQLENVSQ